MSKLRYVRTKFWTDPFVAKLNGNGKLLFLYFLTNPFTNVAGIYEITLRQIVFDTGMKEAEVNKQIKIFQEHNKLFYINEYVIVKNFQKNQNLSPKIKKAILDIMNILPENITNITGKTYPIDTVSYPMDNKNMNMNIEDEVENERLFQR